MSRKPFVMIDAEILNSSVWDEEPHVKIVWITLLILCDTEGYVGASVPGIARQAGVTLAQAEEAMERLMAPDPHSRTKERNGRRVEVAERGFRILNFIQHLERLASERVRNRDRVRRHREKKRVETDVALPTITVPTGRSEEGIGNREERGERTPARSPSWTREACDDWNERFGAGSAPGGRIGGGLRNLVKHQGWENVRPAWKRYLAEKDADFASAQDFASHFGDWQPGGKGGRGRKRTVSEKSREVLKNWRSD